MYCGSTSVKLLDSLFCLSWHWTPVQDLQVFYYSLCVLKTRQEREGIQILPTTKLLYISDNMQTQLRTQSPPSSSRHSVMLYKQMEFTGFMGLYQSVCNIVVDCLNHWTTGNTNVNVSDITFLQRTDMFNLYIRLGWNLLEENKENVACFISSNLAGKVPKSQQNDPSFWLENVATSKIFSSLMVTNAETQAWAVVTGSAVFSLLHHRLHLLTWNR